MNPILVSFMMFMQAVIVLAMLVTALAFAAGMSFLVVAWVHHFWVQWNVVQWLLPVLP